MHLTSHGSVAVVLLRNVNALHFRSGHLGQVPAEEEEQSKEEPKAAHEKQEVEDSGYEVAPARRQEVAAEGRDRDDEALEPHPDVDQDADHHRCHQVAPDLT